MDCEGHATCVLWSPFHGKPTHAQSIKSAKWRGSQHLGSTLSKDMTLNPAAVLHFFLNQTLHISVQKVMDNAARNAFDRLH